MKCLVLILAPLALTFVSERGAAQGFGGSSASTPSSFSAPRPAQTAPPATTTANEPSNTSLPQTQNQPDATNPAASTKQPIGWAARGLQEELAKSVRIADEQKPKKSSRSKLRLTEEKVAELRKKVALDEKDVKTRIRLAEHFDASDDHQQVIETLRPVFDSLPRKGLILLARGFAGRKDHLDEVRVLETLIAQKSKDYHAHFLLGDAYASLGKREQALTKYEEAKAINPKYLPPYEALLRESKRGGFLHDSVQSLEDMITNFGTKPRFASELCLIYSVQAFLDKAVEICKSAIDLDTENPANHVFLALALRDKDGNEAGEKILKHAAQKFKNSELAQWAAGELAFERKNYPAAQKYFRAATQADAASGRAQAGLAKVSFLLKDYAESLKAFTEACKLDRSSLPEFRKSASILRRENNFQWAERFDSGLGKCGIN